MNDSGIVPPFGTAAAPLRLLIIDDDAHLRDSCAAVLAGEGYEVTTCGRAEDARDLMQRRGFDLALIDLHLPVMSGTELLKLFLANHPGSLAVIMTGQPDIESGVNAMQAGAWDYLPKPFTATHLQILLGRARYIIETTRRSDPRGDTAVQAPPRPREVRSRPVAPSAAQGGGPRLLGTSPAFLRMIQLAEQVAKTSASVFLTGESGAGKEMIAQLIHARSPRHRQQLVAVNCAALPENLLESEMFGHSKGAFTGAVRDKPGLLEVAHNGTFFLDELTEMPIALQAKLLRVLQDGVVRRVGSEKVDAQVDVRFVAATNRDPMQAVRDGRLRKDLFYRLGVVPIHVPPLRERVEDIPVLAEHFLRAYWAKHRGSDEPLPCFTKEALAALSQREWSGNVRELQNVIEHAVVVLQAGSFIRPDDIPYLDERSHRAEGGFTSAGHPSNRVLLETDYHTAREQIIAEFELHYIRGVMERSDSNLSRAAKIAGIDRTTLYRLLQKHGLHRDATFRVLE